MGGLARQGPTVCCTLRVVLSWAMYDQLVVETSEERFDKCLQHALALAAQGEDAGSA